MDEPVIPMRPRLIRENLHGVWAAIATPFDADNRFVEDAFRENLRRLHASGVHGVYTTDSDGELLRGPGNLHGIVGKALLAASPFLVARNRTRRPYLAIPDDAVQQFRHVMEDQFSDLF